MPESRLTVVLNGTTGLGQTVQPADDYLPGRPLVLTVGYLIPRKGLRDLVAAVGRLRRRGRTVDLAVVGDGPLEDSLLEQAAAEGVADTVHFLGRVPHARVLQLMARADLFALPSWDEAFGLVYTEAMAQGTPVVAGKGEGPEDFIEDGVSGYLVAGSRPGRAGRYHRDCTGRPAEGGGVGEAGKAAALALSWERNARLTLRGVRARPAPRRA